jgi:hypothetical protein
MRWSGRVIAAFGSGVGLVVGIVTLGQLARLLRAVF